MGWRDAPLVSPSPAASPTVSGWRSAPIVEEAAPPSRGDESRVPIGVDPRMEPETMFTPEEWQPAGRAAVGALAGMGAMAVPGVPAAAGTLLRFAGDPRVGAAYAGGKTLLETGDLSQAGWAAGGAYVGQKAVGKVLGAAGTWMSKALRARMAHQVARAAVEAVPVAEAVATEAAPAAKVLAADMEALLIKATDATAPPQVRVAARVALQKAGWTPEAGMMATPIAEEVAAPIVQAPAKALTMPVKGNVKPATVFTRPAGAAPTRSAAARKLQSSGAESLKAQQLEAAKAAGLDVGETFGTAPVAGKAEQTAESALETRLRASVLMKKNPTALANEIADHVVSLGKVKPERAVDMIQELYGIPAANAKQMVEMVFQAQGWR